MQPTRQQQAAITTIDRALLVDAGAGTGKTRVLTERFLHLLEVHPTWSLESIVAVTFTEKAAREMRTRIRAAIETRAMRRTADTLWQNHRRNLDQLRVSTIHSLCSRILKENAIAAGVDPRFELLDEPSARLLQEEAMSNVFDSLAQKDDPILELLASLRVADLQDELAGLLALRSTVTRLFDDLPDSETLLAAWREQVTNLYGDVWESKVLNDSNLSAAIDTFPVEITKPADGLVPSITAANEGFALVRQGEFLQAACLFDQISLNRGSQTAWGGKEAFQELKEMLKAAREAGRAVLAIGEFGEADRQAANLLQLWRNLWQHVITEYDRLKAAHQSLDFDDLLVLTARLLQDHADTPRLKAFRAGIKHLMVDEFQDTNVLQKQIVYALASPQDGGKLFVVGDAKQSIYRFLQAQVSVFNATCDEITQATGQSPLPLNQSFRTHDMLVKAVNSLFDHVLQPAGPTFTPFEAQPGPLEATRRSRDAAAVPVEMLILPKKDANDTTVKAEIARRWEAHWLARRLKALEAGRFEVWDREREAYRPFRYDDAAVLFRATPAISLYEEAFKAAGLPYLTISGRGYYDRPEIHDLLALLGCLYNPSDDLHLAAALRSPLFGLSDETLYRLRWHGSDAATPVAYALALAYPPETDQPEAIAFANDTLKALWGMAGRVSVWELLRKALDLTGYEAVLALDDQATGERQLNNVQKFMTMARDKADVSLATFLQQVQDLRAREVRESEAAADAPQAGAVQLMTVHAAKGLEFPVVAVADMGRTLRKQTSSRILHDPQFGLVCKQRDEYGDWQEPASYVWGKQLHQRMEIAEHKRLFYVACTRAGDLLLLCGQESGEDTWLTYATEAWGIDVSGPDEQVLALDEFSVRLFRPTEVPDLERRDQQVGPTISPEAEASAPAYELAWPLEQVVSSRPIAVTRAIRQEPAEAPQIQPAVGTDKRVPASVIGDMVHHALANWDCLELPPAQLEQWLARDVRRMGVTNQAAIQHAVQWSVVMLRNLTRAPLYEEIQAAQQRYSELPVMLQANHRLIHGSVDLLYQDKAGVWHLIDWKTEYLDPNQHQEQIQAHKQQLALYVSAVHRQIDEPPEAMLCFLNPKLVQYRLEIGNGPARSVDGPVTGV